MKATRLEKSLEKSFRVAGGNPSRQPSTFSLLGGYFTKEDLSSLFPGRLNGAQAEKNGKLAMEFLALWKFRVVKCGQRNLDYSVKASQLRSFKVKRTITV